MNRETKTINISILLGITIVLIGAVFYFVAPIPQDLAYHQFVDQRVFLSIPNFLNVFSNLAFIVIGIYCLFILISRKNEINDSGHRSVYYVFFVGLILTGFGSGYYHLSPDNQTLVWDRLPMAIAFMALFSFFLSEHINVRLGTWLLWPLLAIGLFSVLYWIYTENLGAGDLRLYALVQFLPVLLIPLIIILFPSHTYRKKYIWYLIGLYALAKVAEHYDDEIMSAVSISGHTLKHIFAAFSGIAFLKIILSRHNDVKANI
jgi:hypothetical protein